MLDKRNSWKSVVLIGYGLLVLIAGIFYVPCYEVWGPERNVDKYSYHFRFQLSRGTYTINGFRVTYEIDFARVLYTMGVLTLLAATVWLLLATWSREDRDTAAAD
ncbi:hypothetical protein [Cohnella sp. REN36]|uniref:hypothetical protein n=1 Tax=Cohnella sp. REN36 TaxID=2887347 RepID=UPI001D143409|nr:hypothetical protein [Cohnella sp. REN36]MCC3371779.1 hypothetical protein [Cohnella sp. REN36]